MYGSSRDRTYLLSENILHLPGQLPTLHILDATGTEEQAVPLKLVVLYSFSNDGYACFAGMRMLGSGDLPLEYLKTLLRVRDFPDRNDYILTGSFRMEKNTSRIWCCR
jgi:hypothetical protein